MKKTVVLYEKNEIYGRRLAEYVNRKQNLSFCMVLFTDPDKLEEWCRRTEANLLLCDSAERERAARVRIKKRLFLTGRGTASRELEGGEDTLWRYQSVEQMIPAIERCLAEGLQGSGRDNGGGASIYAVYSPAGDGGGELFSLLLGQVIAGICPVLYLSLDAFPGLWRAVGQEEGGLTDALFYLAQGELGAHLEELVHRWHGLSVLGGVSHPEDLADLTAERAAGLIDELAEQGHYGAVVADCGSSVHIAGGVIGMSRKVFVPGRDDPLSSLRSQAFARWVEKRGADHLRADIVSVSMPAVRAEGSLPLWLEEQIWGPAGEYVKQVAEREGLLNAAGGV